MAGRQDNTIVFRSAGLAWCRVGAGARPDHSPEAASSISSSASGGQASDDPNTQQGEVTRGRTLSNHSPNPTPPKRTIYYILLPPSKRFLPL